MNVFIAGATGTLGRAVVRELVARGHRVTGLTRSDSGRRLLDTFGAASDRPMPMTEFLTLLTRRIGVRAARGVPMWIVNLGAPLIAKSGSLELRLSNAKAKHELGWTLRYPTVSEGLGELPGGRRRLRDRRGTFQSIRHPTSTVNRRDGLRRDIPLCIFARRAANHMIEYRISCRCD